MTNGLLVGSSNAIGVGAVKTGEMVVWLWDMNEHSCEKLERVGEGRVELESVSVSVFGLVEEKSGVSVESQSRKVDGSPHEIAGQLVQSLGVVGVDGGAIMDAKTEFSTKGAGRCALVK